MGSRPFLPRIHLESEQGIFFFPSKFCPWPRQWCPPPDELPGWGSQTPRVRSLVCGASGKPPELLVHPWSAWLPSLHLASGLGFLRYPSSSGAILGPLAALGSGSEGVKGKLLGPLRESHSGLGWDLGAFCEAPSGSGADAQGGGHILRDLGLRAIDQRTRGCA